MIIPRAFSLSIKLFILSWKELNLIQCILFLKTNATFLYLLFFFPKHFQIFCFITYSSIINHSGQFNRSSFSFWKKFSDIIFWGSKIIPLISFNTLGNTLTIPRDLNSFKLQSEFLFHLYSVELYVLSHFFRKIFLHLLREVRSKWKSSFEMKWIQWQ